MIPETKKYRSKEKVAISQDTINALRVDRKRYTNKTEHIDAIGISYVSYAQIMKTKKARTDVVEKVETYLKQVA